MSSEPFSVIIPAHNEAKVIGRCLAAIYEDDRNLPHPNVLVVANGCTDNTAQMARHAAPDAKVIELEQSSKTAALNLGMSRATAPPLVVLDADIECSLQSLTALADTVRNGAAFAAIPLADFELSKASYAVRAYYRVWKKQPFASTALGGSGCYALSKEALVRIGQFPDIIADDLWALSHFSADERKLVERTSNGRPVFARVFPPRTMMEQIRVEARRRMGNQQVEREYSYKPAGDSHQRRLLPDLFRSGAAPIDALIFLSMKLASKLLCEWNALRGEERKWVRDESSRQANR